MAEMMAFPYIGSVSHGTMRPEDLIPAFMDVLEELAPLTAAAIVADYEAVWSTLGEWDYHPDTPYMLADLFEALDCLAPDGYYFGAHEGDGSDYGFWPVDSFTQEGD